MENELRNNIFSVSYQDFNQIALDVFLFQSKYNAVYREYLNLLKIDPLEITSVDQIPFLPISFFKTHRVLLDGFVPEMEFVSSGTTGNETSTHYIPSISLYIQSFLKGFEQFYGSPSQYCILALLPTYLERQNSSLVFMVNHLIKQSNNSDSGFFLYNFDELADVLRKQVHNNEPTILIGVTFALLELAKKHSFDLKKTIVMETGGMKGRGKELVREELHSILTNAFSVNTIHSEYGMTELLSQAYSMGKGVFRAPPWMKVQIRDPYDPFTTLPALKSGAINIIDLANLYSCSFIQTDDLGLVYPDGSFEVLGRMEGSQIRGCNLLVST